MMAQFMENQDGHNKKMEHQMRQIENAHQSSIHNVECQLGKLARKIAEREQGKFPSNIETNPKEGAMAISLRSGKEVNISPKEKKKDDHIVIEEESDKKFEEEVTMEKYPPIVKVYVPPIPYPQRQRKRINEALAQMPSYAKFLKEIVSNKNKLEEYSMVALTEECSAILQKKLPSNCLCDLGASINLMPLSVVKKLGITEIVDIIDKIVKETFVKESYNEPLEACLAMSLDEKDDDVEIIEYALSLEGNGFKKFKHFVKFEELGEGANDTYPVTISAKLSSTEEEKFLRILRNRTSAIAWTIADIKGISSSICMHKILAEDEFKPSVQGQRRLNPNMKEVVRAEAIKLLDGGSSEERSTTVVKNENNELIPTRVVTGWRVCKDYRKLNTATRKDHFSLPFIDQMLERLAGYGYYCFLDGYSGYNQIPIEPEDQEKTTFTCPYGTFAYRRMPFGLCNAPATFERCMMSIFFDMVEDIIEIFMDDFSVFGSSFDVFLAHLDKVLQR
ncbi:uncharacterized protein LOC126681797 [Mercurialis annua]|uniref:uncharacterized protein LOC126681797 n=1 Tax=Mercurialis annua TaxID=3986 RepID=UPI00216105E9|nr:uncharacterized protein LOC126681797 [Mercurialis annua]